MVLGAWNSESASLGRAAAGARAVLVTVVAPAQRQRRLPSGDTERAAALVHALAHGAVDLALAGHLTPDMGRADPAGLVEDLLTCLRAVA
ncbi:WHG domain-containing protein [Nocardiopsis metallicus]|uniref:WHG domain-containing protein n=1 Tax=Nocardiopsis metallicus TaxID=179819 RepID=UPI001FE9A615